MSDKRVIVYGTASEQALVRTIEELRRENAVLRESLAIEQERSLYWRDISKRKEAQPIRADHIGDINEMMQREKEVQP